MGGPGSGRWPWGKGDARPLVESSRRLNATDLVRSGTVVPGRETDGRLTWSRNGRETAAINYRAEATEDRGKFRLLYRLRMTPEPVLRDYAVDLVTTRLPSGGLRWWFLCPVCGGHRADLYSPRGGSVFACRRCHRLTYESSRDSRRWDGLYRLLGGMSGGSPRSVKAVMIRDEREKRRESRLTAGLPQRLD